MCSCVYVRNMPQDTITHTQRHNHTHRDTHTHTHTHPHRERQREMIPHYLASHYYAWTSFILPSYVPTLLRHLPSFKSSHPHFPCPSLSFIYIPSFLFTFPLSPFLPSLLLSCLLPPSYITLCHLQLTQNSLFYLHHHRHRHRHALKALHCTVLS